MKKTKANWCWRFGIYLMGLMMTSIGVTLSSKAGLGLSTVTSFPYAISQAFGTDFALMTFLIYVVAIILQFVIKGKNRQWRDVLQLPVNFVFSSFLAWFETLVPIHFEQLWQNLILTSCAVVIIGIGAAMMVDMNLAPNPPDGLTQAMSAAMKIDLGAAKNLLDAICVVLAILIDFLFHGGLVSVGIGTIIAMVFLGRTIFVFNRLFKTRILKLAGLA